MIKILNEEYLEVSAFIRQLKCKCGKRFFKQRPEQILCGECLATEIEREFHNADIVSDEQDEISFEEAHGAYQDGHGKWQI